MEKTGQKPDAEDALNTALGFLLMGVRIRRDDGDDAVRRIRQILAGRESREAVRRAVATYRSTGSTDAFLSVLCPLHDRVFYEGYGPYWLSHCRPVEDRDAETEFSFYNDLIGMYWSGAWQEWKRKGKWEVAAMLPPTAGLLQLSYMEEKGRWRQHADR